MRRAFIAVAAAMTQACSAGVSIDTLEGQYAPACDSNATIDFARNGTATVNRNYCEGYAKETWDYEIEGETLTLAPDGRADESGVVNEIFTLTSATELTLSSDRSYFACGNCGAGDLWSKQ